MQDVQVMEALDTQADLVHGIPNDLVVEQPKRTTSFPDFVLALEQLTKEIQCALVLESADQLHTGQSPRAFLTDFVQTVLLHQDV